MNADSEAENPLRPADRARRRPPVVVLVAWLASALPLALVLTAVAVVVPVVPWWLGLVAGLLAAAAIVWNQLRTAANRLLGALAAVPADPDRHARYFNVAQGLSLAGGIAEPELHLVTDDARNAAAVAQRDRSAIVVTTGLLEAIDRVGLEGILAEALVRIGNGDAEAATTGAALFRPLLAGPLAPLFRPLAGYGLGRLLGDDRDLSADRAAVALTRYPPGLLAAFDLIRAGTPAVASGGAATDHVWMVPPAAVDDGADVVVAPAPLDLRIDVLGEL